MAGLDVRALAQKVGFRGKALNTIVGIVMAESGGRANAHNGNAATGDNSYGLAQINMLGAMGPERRKQFGLSSNADLLDPETNLRVAYALSNKGRNFTPWSTYKSGAYKAHLGDSGATVAKKGTAGTPKVDTIDQKDLAAQYGWALSVLKSDPSLAKLFNQAVANTWTPERFVAELRGTKWFQHHSEAQRNAVVLKNSDPQTWKQKVQETDASVRDMAVGMGAQMSSTAIRRITSNVLNFGWNDNQIRDALAGAVKMGGAGTYGGQAAGSFQKLSEVAHNNGVKIADKTMQSWVQRIAAGEDPAGFDQYVRGMAKSAFPSFAEQIDAGQDVADLAQPYINSMATTLEVDPATVDLFDPTIRKALQAQTPDGKIASKPLWQFENELRADSRFDKTQAANQTAAKFADSLTKMFGASA